MAVPTSQPERLRQSKTIQTRVQLVCPSKTQREGEGRPHKESTDSSQSWTTRQRHKPSPESERGPAMRLAVPASPLCPFATAHSTGGRWGRMKREVKTQVWKSHLGSHGKPTDPSLIVWMGRQGPKSGGTHSQCVRKNGTRRTGEECIMNKAESPRPRRCCDSHPAHPGCFRSSCPETPREALTSAPHSSSTIPLGWPQAPRPNFSDLNQAAVGHALNLNTRETEAGSL